MALIKAHNKPFTTLLNEIMIFLRKYYNKFTECENCEH